MTVLGRLDYSPREGGRDFLRRSSWNVSNRAGKLFDSEGGVCIVWV